MSKCQIFRVSILIYNSFDMVFIRINLLFVVIYICDKIMIYIDVGFSGTNFIRVES